MTKENCCPQVAAFTLETGRQKLKACGYVDIRIIETKPDPKAEPEGTRRIVRQRMLADWTIELVVSNETYIKGVRSNGV